MVKNNSKVKMDAYSNTVVCKVNSVERIFRDGGGGNRAAEGS